MGKGWRPGATAGRRQLSPLQQNRLKAKRAVKNAGHNQVNSPFSVSAKGMQAALGGAWHDIPIHAQTPHSSSHLTTSLGRRETHCDGSIKQSPPGFASQATTLYRLLADIPPGRTFTLYYTSTGRFNACVVQHTMLSNNPILFHPSTDAAMPKCLPPHVAKRETIAEISSE